MKARLFRPLLLLALAPASPAMADTPPVAPVSLSYGIDLNRRADDLFHVTLRVSGLRPENAVYQFASTAPGTYQVMNIGRYVRAFEAFDARGRRVPAEQVSVNQWRLSDPARVRTIRYAVTETWDSPLGHPIYKMCGTSIEADHVLLNPHAVIGYPEGLQACVAAFASGGYDAAREAFLPYLPLVNFEQQVRIALAVRKEALRRRGLIVESAARPPAVAFPASLSDQLDRHLASVPQLEAVR